MRHFGFSSKNFLTDLSTVVTLTMRQNLRAWNYVRNTMRWKTIQPARIGTYPPLSNWLTTSMEPTRRITSYWRSPTLLSMSGREMFRTGLWERSGRRPILIFKSNLILVSHWHLHEKDHLSTNACGTSSMPIITWEISWTRMNNVGLVCADASKLWRRLHTIPMSNWVVRKDRKGTQQGTQQTE